MKNIHINKRLAYTDQELISLVMNNMSSLGMTSLDLFNKYKDYFMSQNELNGILEDKIDFTKEFYYFIDEFLGISIEDATEIVYDKEIISARKDLNTPEEISFIDMLNLFFDTMIKCERFCNPTYMGSNDYSSGAKLLKDYNLSEMASFAKDVYGIEEFSEISEMLSSREGYFIIEFPNELGISGITMIKDTRFDDKKHICIYINSREPIGRRNFTYAHEIYHVLFESSSQNVSYYDSTNEVESRADEFASEMIFNRDKMYKIIFDMNLSYQQELDFQDITNIQESLNASFIAVLSNFDQLKKKEQNPDLIKRIPKINRSLYKYKSPKHWAELIQRSMTFTKLNNFDFRYYAQSSFISNLDMCYKKKLIGSDEYDSFISFFDIERGVKNA